MENYTITREQFLSLGHYNRMFELFSGNLERICSKGYEDEISLGFELGKLHGDIRDSYFGMMELLNDIKNGESSDLKSFEDIMAPPPWEDTDKSSVPYHTICGCNPANGGSGVCGCIMANKMVSKGGGTIISTTSTGTI